MASTVDDDDDDQDGAYRAAQDELEALQKSLAEKPKKDMDQYLPMFKRNTQFFSEAHPNVIEHALVQCIEKRNFKLKRSENKYKITFDVVRGVNAKPLITQMTVRIMEVDEDKCLVDFSMNAGGQHSTFMEIFKSMVKSKELAFAYKKDE